MNSTPRPREQGSEFHIIGHAGEGQRFVSPWEGRGLYFGTGRDALKAVLMHGMATMGWKRLKVPSYFCQTVVRSLLQTGIAISPYQSWFPGDQGRKTDPEVTTGDVLLIVNHFGLAPKIHFDAGIRDSITIIEDHTHDPWSSRAYNSAADYCIASLRKTLPVPDGGVLWSPAKHDLPCQPILTEEHRRAAREKLEAMRLKGSYLSGQKVDKSKYRELSTSGEQHLCGREVSAISPWSAAELANFPVMQWRAVRKRNHDAFGEVLSDVSWARVLSPSDSSDSVPFSCIVLFDGAERREFVRLGLIEGNIYPAILWPLERPAINGISEESVAASRCMLSIHCDMRYSIEEMADVASSLKLLGDRFSSNRI